MSVKLTLTRKGTNPEAVPGGLERHNWPLIVEAAGTNIPSEIFVWHAVTSLDAVPGDQFEAVASVHQLETVPTEYRRTQLGGQLCPFYRTRRLELFCRHAEEAEIIWKKLQADAKQLVLNWKLKDALVSEEVVITDGGTDFVTADAQAEPEDVPLNWSDLVFDENLNGTVDGSNRVFSVDHLPAMNTLQVFRNGVRVYGEGADYELAGQTITFVVAPTVGSRLTANYIIAP